ncbi:MAG: transposase [Flammeovirgaceae bacterium]
MILSEIGMIAHKFWAEIPLHYSFVKLGEWIIMPNHTHGIIIINKSQNHNSDHKCAVRTRHCLVPNTKNMTNKDKKITIGKSRFQNQGANTISSIIGNYKSIVTKNARKILPEFAWQARYYDHIIRTETAYENISNYIQNNPRNWRKDKF